MVKKKLQELWYEENNRDTSNLSLRDIGYHVGYKSGLIRAINLIREEKPDLEFWTVENTGWSGGISWFKTGGTEANPLRFDTDIEGFNFALEKKKENNDPNMLWRVVHTTITREENKETIVKEYTLC